MYRHSSKKDTILQAVWLGPDTLGNNTTRHLKVRSDGSKVNGITIAKDLQADSEFTAFSLLEWCFRCHVGWAAFLIGLSHFLQDFVADRHCIRGERSDDKPKAALRKEAQE